MDESELRAQLEGTPLMRLVALAGHVIGQRFGRVFGRVHGLTPAGAAVLSVLTWGAGRGLDQGTPGRATHADLARRCWIAPPTLTGVIDTLEKAGYVRRERDETDRRVVWLVVTDDGTAKVREFSQGLMDLFEPTKAEQDPMHLEIVRGFLIELITKNHDKE